MATVDSMALLDVLHNCAMDREADFLQGALWKLVQALMEAEASSQVGAQRYERSEQRQTRRNGHRERDGDTRMGTLPLQIPKLRKGTYFPSFLEPRRRNERALLAVVQEAYVHGVSTRKVDDRVKSLGMEGISKSEVSRIVPQSHYKGTGLFTLNLGRPPHRPDDPERHIGAYRLSRANYTT